MNKNVAIVIALVVAAAVALAFKFDWFAPFFPTTGPCGNIGASDRCVPVTVTTTGTTAQIAPIANVTMAAQGEITWYLTPTSSAGFQFPNDGIDFANPGTPPPTSPPKVVAPANEFRNCAPKPPGNTQFKCINRHGNNGTWAYKVTVTGPVAVPPLDPFVINN